MARVRLEDGSDSRSTDDHQFFVAGAGWVRGRELAAGDRLLGVDRRQAPIRSVGVEERPAAPVYNLVVEGAKTYYVGRTPVLVHSCDTALNLLDWSALALGRPRRLRCRR